MTIKQFAKTEQFEPVINRRVGYKVQPTENGRMPTNVELFHWGWRQYLEAPPEIKQELEVKGRQTLHVMKNIYESVEAGEDMAMLEKDLKAHINWSIA